uniref:Cadherin domain-containing protein n=1 Tax=Chelydra serpentina TaxID=8475 RepID=A0A8C3RLP0_CHESE
LTREIHVLGPLDYESKQVYILTVQLRDVANEVDPRHQRSVLCTITIRVQVTLRCTPPLVVTRIERFWAPSPWFVAVLTVSMALLLLTLAWLAWKLLSLPGCHPRMSQVQHVPISTFMLQLFW